MTSVSVVRPMQRLQARPVVSPEPRVLPASESTPMNDSAVSRDVAAMLTLAGQPLSSNALLSGNATVQIAHNGALYTLRATKHGKLILTK